MAPYRSNRSGARHTRTTQIDHDVVEGLPIRHWRKKTVAITNTTDHLRPEDGIKLAYPELPLPRDFSMLPDNSQILLRAARMGLLKDNDMNEIIKAQYTKPNELEPVLTATKWTLIPRDQEGPEPEFLAKRRKGLPSAYNSGTLPSDATISMRKTKIKTTTSSGEGQILEALIPVGQIAPGEVVGNDTLPSQISIPGTVIDGLGVVNADGLVVIEAPLIPVSTRRKPPIPQKRKKKGINRGQKLMRPDQSTADNKTTFQGSHVDQSKSEGIDQELHDITMNDAGVDDEDDDSEDLSDGDGADPSSRPMSPVVDNPSEHQTKASEISDSAVVAKSGPEAGLDLSNVVTGYKGEVSEQQPQLSITGRASAGRILGDNSSITSSISVGPGRTHDTEDMVSNRNGLRSELDVRAIPAGDTSTQIAVQSETGALPLKHRDGLLRQVSVQHEDSLQSDPQPFPLSGEGVKLYDENSSRSTIDVPISLDTKMSGKDTNSTSDHAPDAATVHSLCTSLSPKNLAKFNSPLDPSTAPKAPESGVSLSATLDSHTTDLMNASSNCPPQSSEMRQTAEQLRTFDDRPSTVVSTSSNYEDLKTHTYGDHPGLNQEGCATTPSRSVNDGDEVGTRSVGVDHTNGHNTVISVTSLLVDEIPPTAHKPEQLTSSDPADSSNEKPMKQTASEESTISVGSLLTTSIEPMDKSH